jgi:cell division cycle protein 37
VDTISHPGFEKTVINTGARKKDDNLTEEEREERTKKFYDENEKLIKEYGMLQKYDDSKKFLQEHQQLVCEDTANYLVLWCINLAMEEVSFFVVLYPMQRVSALSFRERKKRLVFDLTPDYSC